LLVDSCAAGSVQKSAHFGSRIGLIRVDRAKAEVEMAWEATDHEKAEVKMRRDCTDQTISEVETGRATADQRLLAIDSNTL
jgi:hypothetical protein